MVEALAPVGLDSNAPTAPLTIDSPLEERLAYAAMAEEGMGAALALFAAAIPDASGVTTTTTTITGEDGNDVTLYISRPDVDGPVPAIVHLHGGGMAIASAADATYMRLRQYIAGTGLVVVGVEFRNSGGKLGPYRFPAGLNDCAAGVRWVAANRAELGVSHLIVAGESGGGNLTLTVAHKAKREGWLDEIAGFYAQCPYISNRWHDAPDELPSLRECDGYFISLQQLELLGSIYDPENQNSNDPTCFAGVATDEDLKGLPPHVISVNEVDPLRDEGLDYYRRLVRAGVPTVGRLVAGTCHGGDLIFAGAMPDVFTASIRDLSGFAKSLG
jgi:acetyl esterase/lipase